MQLRESTEPLDRIDDGDVPDVEGLEQDNSAGVSNAADNFFYCVFVIAMVFVIEHTGLYAPGL